MKKITLIFILTTAFFSCSDTDSDAVQNRTLEGVILTPANSNVIGYGHYTGYELKRGDEFLEIYNYTWTSSDTLVAVGRDGGFISRLVGQATITVSDNEGNTLTSVMTVNPKITNMPDVPFIRWGANYNEIITSINSDWILVNDNTSYPVFKKGSHAVKYRIEYNALVAVEFIENYDSSIGFGGGTTDSNRLIDYNNENYIRMMMNDPNWNGFQRWWYTNEHNQKVFIGIFGDSSHSYYKLVYSKY